MWTKTLRDVLAIGNWREIKACKTTTWRSPLGHWRLRVETLGKYPGYGWRVWIRRTAGDRRSFFLPDEEAVTRWLLS